MTLEVCYEFYLRGFHFDTIDIYRSDASKFLITEGGLLPPLISVHGLGEAAAVDTVEKRKGKTFISVEEFSMCCNKLSKTHIEQLKALGAFAGMAEKRSSPKWAAPCCVLSVIHHKSPRSQCRRPRGRS